MQGLPNCDGVTGTGGEFARFRRGDAIFHAAVRLSLFDLLRAGVDRDHPLEKLRQRHGGLPVAGGAIERQLFARGIGRDEFEKRARIPRPKSRVVRRLSRKVILKTHLRVPS